MSAKTSMAAGLFVGLFAAGGATATEDTLGQEIYQARCAVCHGATGFGDGIIGELFAKRPGNLTTLAKANNGAFPFSEVFQAIDGRREIAGHGRSEMPVWGDYFMVDAIEDPGINEKNARFVTQGRILSIVYYLESIQNR